MKELKILVILIISAIAAGCSKESSITVAVEKGYECPQNIMDSIEDYYSAGNVVIKEVARSELGNSKYEVSVGAVEMGSALGYGVWKSKVIGYDNACSVSYDDYKISEDFSGKKAGMPEDFNYSNYIYLDDDCEYSNYSNTENMLTDLKEGAIDAVICSPDTAELLKASDNNLRVNDLLDSSIYEYVVVSEDIELINSLDMVIE